MEIQEQEARQQKLVRWVIWAAFLIGVCVQYHFLHSKKAPAPEESSTWLLALIPTAVSMIIRLNVLPRMKDPQRVLAFLVLGVALAEAPAFIGMFVFPAHQWELFLAAFFGIALHAPIYAGGLLSPPKDS